MATLQDRVNETSVQRLAAKRACDAAEGTDAYPALLRHFRALDHKREDLRAEWRKQRAQ